MNRFLVVVGVSLVLISSAQAAVLAIDFGAPDQLQLAGYEPFSLAVAGSTTQTEVYGAYTVTLTALADSGLSPRFQARNRNGGLTPPASPDDNILVDYIRCETTINTRDQVGGNQQMPVTRVEIAGLSASTTYGVTIGAWDPWGAPGPNPQILRAGPGTTGSPLSQVWTGAPEPANAGDYSASGSFTTDGAGVLTVELAYDMANWNVDSDPQAILGYMAIIPEPATMSLLGLGALALLRRRR